jgi:ribosome maturation factor RimP
MDRESIINELRNIFSSYLEAQGLDLVDLIYRYEGRDLFLRILVDNPSGGISLSECAELNQELGRILDEKDIMPQRYILEVSSPGLDRPLKEKKDFLRCINRKVRFYLSEPINGKLEVEGTIEKVEETSVYIDREGVSMEISLSKVNKAKQVVE